MKENMDSAQAGHGIAEKCTCAVRDAPGFILLRNSIAEFDFAVKKYVGEFGGLCEVCWVRFFAFLGRLQPKVAGAEANFCVQ
ncbi:MAG: hypothetical protein LUC95_07690 [Lachnospiraceae bacterium]|nr:hypothetical protein [Lachnospiraceae bacterium]